MRTGLSRDTIAKYLNAGMIGPSFTTPGRPSKLDPFADKLAAWLSLAEPALGRASNSVLRLLDVSSSRRA
jgi:hypothetical protein